MLSEHQMWYFWSAVGDFLQEIISVLHNKSISGKMSEFGKPKTLSEINKENHIQISRHYVSCTLLPQHT
jgi:hypothetical protein